MVFLRFLYASSVCCVLHYPTGHQVEQVMANSFFCQLMVRDVHSKRLDPVFRDRTERFEQPICTVL